MTTDERIDALTAAVAKLAENTTQRLKTLTAAVERLPVAIEAAEQRAIERARDMQTEILRGIEAFARGNFARMGRL